MYNSLSSFLSYTFSSSLSNHQSASQRMSSSVRFLVTVATHCPEILLRTILPATHYLPVTTTTIRLLDTLLAFGSIVALLVTMVVGSPIEASSITVHNNVTLCITTLTHRGGKVSIPSSVAPLRSLANLSRHRLTYTATYKTGSQPTLM